VFREDHVCFYFIPRPVWGQDRSDERACYLNACRNPSRIPGVQGHHYRRHRAHLDGPSDESEKGAETDSVEPPDDSASDDTETGTDADSAIHLSDSAPDDTETGTETDSACAPDITDISDSAASYPEVDELPNPFLFLDGAEVTRRADWRCRREELSQLVQVIEYGPYPPKPDNVAGEMNGDTLIVTVEADGRSISFDAAVTKPGGDGPFPAFIAISTITPCVTAEEVTPKGIAFITYDPLDISVDGDSHTGEFYTLYDTAPHTGNLMAWAWAVHRIMDALVVTPPPASTRRGSPLWAAGATARRPFWRARSTSAWP
jgi:hypothetical protein